jgi:hypothetical protein
MGVVIEHLSFETKWQIYHWMIDKSSWDWTFACQRYILKDYYSKEIPVCGRLFP